MINMGRCDVIYSCKGRSIVMQVFYEFVSIHDITGIDYDIHMISAVLHIAAQSVFFCHTIDKWAKPYSLDCALY